MEIDEKKLKEILKDEREEFQRHVNVLQEKSDSNFKLVSEQYLSIRETLDSHTEMIASTKEDVEIIKMDIGLIKNSLKKKVDTEEFSVLEKRVAFLEAKI